MKLSSCILYAFLLFSFASNGQSVIFDDPGFTFTAVSGPDPIYEWDTGDIDISDCTSIEISYDYAWSTDWVGSGNLETPDECGACAGDPTDPTDGDCENCWDMLYSQVFLDGSEEDNNLLGGFGFDQQFGSVVMGPLCTDGAATLNIEFDGTVHAVSPLEEVEVTDIMVLCWEAQPVIEEFDPVCAGGQLDLVGDATDIVVSWVWETDGSAVIDNDVVQSTFATGVSDGDEFTLTTTDVNGCMGTETMEVSVTSFDVELDGGGIICNNGCTDEDSDLVIDLMGGNPLYQIDLTVNGINVPFAPATDVDAVFTICADPDIFIPEYDDSTDPPRIIIPSAFFPIDLELSNVVDSDGCVGNIIGGSLTYDLQDSPEINSAESPSYCVGSDGIIDLTLMDDDLDENGFEVIWFEDEDLQDENRILAPFQYNIDAGLTVWAVVSDGDCFSEAVEIDLDVNLIPEIDVFVSPIVGCGTNEYFLPDIDELADITNPTNPGYYLGPGGTDGPVSVIDPTVVDEIYIYDESAEGCFDEAVIPVVIDQQPDIESPLDVLTGCGELILSEPVGTDIDSYEYNIEEDGSGTSYLEGDIIRESDDINTLYLIAVSANGCETVIELDINFESGAIDYIVDIDSLICDSLILPPIFPSSATLAYYTGSMGTGMVLEPGDVIYTPFDGTLYVFDIDIMGDCVSEDTISFVVTDGPQPIFPSDTSACEFIVLPEFGGITGPNIRYAQFPISNPNSTYYPGDTLDFSQRLYVLDTIGGCEYYDSLDITIFTEPFAGLDTSLVACEGFISSGFDLMALLRNPDEGGLFSYPSVPDFNPVDSSDVFITSLPLGIHRIEYVIEDSLCGLYSSSIEFEIVEGPYGGVNNNLDLCVATDPINFMELVSNPDVGGEWTQVSGPDMVNFTDSTAVDLSGITTGAYVFLYVIEGQANVEYCEAASVSLFVNIGSGASAGQDTSFTACQGEVIDLLDYISENAETDGLFEGDNIIFNGSSWNTGASMANQTYEIDYIVQSDDASCPDDTSSISILLVEQLNAGVAPNQIFLCEGDEVDLFSYISGESTSGEIFIQNDPGIPIAGGLWTADQSQEFWHVVEGTEACPSDTLEFAAEVVASPNYNIQIDGSSLCANNLNTAFILFIQHLDLASSQYNIQVLDDNDNVIYETERLSDSNITYYIVSNGMTANEMNDTIRVPESVGVFSVDVIVNDANDFCIPDTVSIENITVSESIVEDIEVELCPGDSFIYNGQSYQSSESIVVPGNGAVCDSIINLNINNIVLEEGMVEAVLCDGESITILGQEYSEDFTGLELFENMGSQGCDSLVQIDIQFESAIFEMLDFTICADEQVEVNNVIYDINNTMGSDTLESVNGCDSILTIQVNVSAVPEGSFTADICEGEDIIIGTDTYDADNLSGMSILENASSSGCDSIVNVQLNLLTAQSSFINDVICAGESLTIGTDVYDENNLTGTSILEGQASNGCDSIVNVQIQVAVAMAVIEVEPICPEDEMGTVRIFDVINLELPLQVEVPEEGLSVAITQLPTDIELGVGSYTLIITGNNMCRYEQNITTDVIGALSADIQVTDNSLNSYIVDYMADFIVDDYIWSVLSNTAEFFELSETELSVTIMEDTEVVLTLVDENGCDISRSITLEYEEEEQELTYYIPNILDVNSLNNNRFTIFTAEGVQLTNLSVYDRWGNLMYDSSVSSGTDISWDGRRNDALVEQGVYVYKAEIQNAQGRNETLIGSITVIR